MIIKNLIFLSLLTTIEGFSFDDALKIHLNGHEDAIDTVPTNINYLYRSKREINSESGKSYVQISINNENITFVLQNTKHLLLSDTVDHEGNCIFQGQSIKPNSSFSIALTGCGNNMQGIILTGTDEYFLLKSPSFHSILGNRSQTHTIQKRSANIHQHHSCGFDLSDDPYPEDRLHVSEPSFLAVHKLNDLVIELGVFVDDAMWQFFTKFYGNLAEAEVKRFVIAAVNNIDILFTRSSIEPKVRLKITHFEILKTMPMPLTRTYHNSGDVSKMLNSFCTYQASINPRNDADPMHWDHALLLTGYDLYRDNVKTIAGYAPVKGMCEQIQNKSCTVNEGLDFGAVFVIAHEMGHSLGMYHDGESNQCNPRCCIMSPSIGAKKTQWSSCSNNELHVFVSKLGSGDRPANCLIDDRKLTLQNEKLYLPDKAFPGQQYSLDEQCSLFHGTCWKHELQTGQTLKDVCDMVWCTNGESVVRNTHPALEGSFCEPGRICIEGKCVNAATKSVTIPPTHGGFGDWDDASKCSKGCNDCLIEGQLRIKRSVRMCNRPFKNNGGRDCPGSDIRGILCGTQTCHGQSVDGYATSKCTTLKSDPNLFYIGLTGKGLQFVQAPCKVWCLVGVKKDVRTMADFPDGTPCGKGKFCLRGECMSLTCTKQTIVATPADCPASVIPRKDPIHKRDINSLPIPTGEWTEFEEWSECIAADCNSTGIKERSRTCNFKDGISLPPQASKPLCLGAKTQRSECKFKC